MPHTSMRLALALTDPTLCPNGARHNSIHAALTQVQNGWQGAIRITWNASFQEAVDGSELTLKSDSVLTWHERKVEKADLDIVNAAWQLGAWEVVRTWNHSLGTHADPFAPHHGLVSLFDPSGTYAVQTGPMGIRGEPIDVKVLIETAARDGWISWKFRPTLRSSRIGGRVAARDITLARDGTRVGDCLYQHQAPVRVERLVVQLGREETSSSEPWTLTNQGATLRAARQRLELSAEGLAARLRLGNNGGRTVRRWEAGEVPISGPAQVAVEFLLNRPAR